jgi:hypothetical protein
MEQHLRGRGTSFMEFNRVYANQLRLEVAEHVRTLARDEAIENQYDKGLFIVLYAPL